MAFFASGNIYEHIYSEVPRRSSMFISERPPPSVRRLSSMVGCGEVVEEINGQTLCLLDQHRTSGPHGRLIAMEMNQPSGQSHHMPASRNDHRPKNDPSTDSEEFLLPPSPFRSPDDLDDQTDHPPVQSAHFVTGLSDRHVPQNFVMQGESAAETMCSQAWKSGGHERRLLESEKEFLDERLRNPWQEMSTLLTMASPDDTTPTNENQPSIFAASQKASFVGCRTSDSENNSVAKVVKGDTNQAETGTNRESAI